MNRRPLNPGLSCVRSHVFHQKICSCCVRTLAQIHPTYPYLQSVTANGLKYLKLHTFYQTGDSVAFLLNLVMVHCLTNNNVYDGSMVTCGPLTYSQLFLFLEHSTFYPLMHQCLCLAFKALHNLASMQCFSFIFHQLSHEDYLPAK